MKSKIEKYLLEVKTFQAEKLEQLEAFRIQFLSKKGIIPSLFSDFKEVAPQDRKEMGQLINTLKTAVQEKIIGLKQQMDSQKDTQASGMDLSLPAQVSLGTRHPLSIVRS